MNITKYIKSFPALIIISVVMLAGCQKAPINGDLDGQWEVMEVTPTPPIVLNERLFYNFSLHVCDLTYYGSLFTHANMKYDGNTLWLEFPFIKENDKPANLILQQFGVLSNPVTFNVDFTDKHHLVLSNEESTVYLVKH